MTLNGKRVLVVEDEALVSMLIEDFLQDMGCEVVGTAPTLKDALAKSSSLEIDAAILDINLRGELSYPVAKVLTSRRIPFLFATGYGVAGLPVDLQEVPVLSKPFGLEQLAAILERTLQKPG